VFREPAAQRIVESGGGAMEAHFARIGCIRPQLSSSVRRPPFTHGGTDGSETNTAE
jgi:hypothetical protein